MFYIPIIKTKRFILRPYKMSDAVALAKNINSKKVCRYTSSIPYPYTLPDARKWLKKCQAGNDKSLNFAIEINGEVAGAVGIHEIVNNHKAEIGYWLAEKYWGKGIVSEAVKLLTGYIFNRFSLKKVYAYVMPPNKASARVLIKNGFKQEGLLRKHIKKAGKFYDAIIFGRIKP